MADVAEPAAEISRHEATLRLLDEPAFLAEVVRIPPLADTDSEVWDDENTWTNAYRLIAAANVIGEMGWVVAIVPLYERAAAGDLYGGMQSIRHGPEKAMRDNLQEFAHLLEPLASHSRPGTREWAIAELGILRLRSSLPVLLEALHDVNGVVRERARASLRMLAQDHPDIADSVALLDRDD